jgi:UDP-N-acetylglucosamine pyrophosphorylase
LAHGTTGAKPRVGAPPPPVHKNLQNKFAKQKCEALQYCDNNEFIELTVGTSRVLMSKAATNNICSNKHKA